MSDRKALLILHGKQALNEEVRAAVDSKREQGWELAVRLTWEAGDAQRLVGEALDAGYRQIIAGGGDGTLRDIAEAMAGGLIGRTLGEDLDRSDRQRALEAEYRALEYTASGQPVAWRTPRYPSASGQARSMAYEAR